VAEYSSRTAVIAALIGNLCIAVTKAIAAAVTGSSAMLSEAVHSLVDTGNEVLLLYGQHRSALPPDRRHAFGHGRELYFWAFVVALLIFALGAGVSIYEGIVHIAEPEPITSAWVVYVVLGLSLLFEAGSWWFGWKAFNRARGDAGFWEAFKESKDPASFMVLFEDTAAILGILIALGATSLSLALDAPWIDGAGSILIGVLLAVIAVLLARESKALLIGERASPEIGKTIRLLAESDPRVVKVVEIATSQLAPDQVIANVALEFEDQLRVPELEQLIDGMERTVRAQHPELLRVFITPQTGGFPERRRAAR